MRSYMPQRSLKASASCWTRTKRGATVAPPQGGLVLVPASSLSNIATAVPTSKSVAVTAQEAATAGIAFIEFPPNVKRAKVADCSNDAMLTGSWWVTTAATTLGDANMEWTKLQSGGFWFPCLVNSVALNQFGKLAVMSAGAATRQRT